jgi:hypothetical protein
VFGGWVGMHSGSPRPGGIAPQSLSMRRLVRYRSIARPVRTGINSVTAQSGFSTEYHLQAFGDATIQGEGYVSGRAIVSPALGLTTLASLESGIIGGGAPSLTWVGSAGMVLTASYRG